MDQEREMIVVPPPTTENCKSIQAIDKEAVHRICSGQVVLNLSTAVKELVENSLDAGATSIEIRLREYGSELVEVVDNGCGVEERNFEGLTLKHHTSKLKEFSDLLGVETFGFRGEALSSLCALSDLTVTTRHKSSQLATKMAYDSRGFIISKTLCARQVGTTVSLANLFNPLPVRQKEFLRNLKREFIKMSQLLHAYCLISTGVKILCSNQTKKGGKSIVVSTQGSSSFKGNIMSVFGVKQANGLLDIVMEMPSENHLQEIGLSSNIEKVKTFELEGFISSCAHGQGRSSTDRQFYFVNNRPCDHSKVSKIVNEVYHQFNMHQFPFVFLNIKTARDSVDVNVTPDKRQIFLDNEKLLIVTVKASLLKLYDKVPNTFQVQNVGIGAAKNISGIPEINISLPHSSLPLTTETTKISNFSTLLKNYSHSSNKCEVKSQQSSQQDNCSIKTGRGVKRNLTPGSYDRDGKKQLCLSDFVSQKKIIPVPSTLEEQSDDVQGICGSDEDFITIPNNSAVERQDKSNSSVDQKSTESILTAPCSPHKTMAFLSHAPLWSTDSPAPEVDKNIDFKMEILEENIESVDDHSLKYSLTDSAKQNPLPQVNNECRVELTRVPASQENSHVQSREVLHNHKQEAFRRKTVSLNVNIEKLKVLFNKAIVIKEKEDIRTNSEKPRVRFYAEIDPSKNKSAEQELSKEITKDMFSKMEIIGQFNLGFIITKLAHDLFIVDQHATDEKYNFETLQAQTTLKNQILVVPQALDLTAANECVLLDNLDIFKKNGFNFVIDRDAEPTKRIRLTAKPISHNWDFGKEDIDELLFMLQDSPNTMCRPSRVRAMFASRACRKSVMIGTALSKSTMRQLVNHMGEIDQPWNCPHGRPTMRHLVNLELVRKIR